MKARTSFNFLFVLLLPAALLAQVREEVVPLQSARRQAAPIFKTLGDTIELPIRDDFSRKQTYPNPAFWADRFALISQTIPVGPLSNGAAVLDGTDEYGMPYNILKNGSDSMADVLTSRYIDFGPVTSNVYLSFLYQRGGNGEEPEVEDSLQVQFWSPADSAWSRVWSAKGTGTIDNFRNAIIPVADPKFLQDGFRFRFASYGALNGFFDCWNIDYVELDINRNAADTLVTEPAYVRQHPQIMGAFSRIPWFHYTDAQLQNSLTFTYRRNGTPPPGGWALSLGKYQLFKDGTLVKDRLTVPVITNLIHNTDVDFNVPLQPVTTGTPSGEFTLFMRSWFDGTAEGLRSNDTVEISVPFENYYAFDDGTAERAYGIINQANARLAIQLQPLQPDSLRGLFINFAHGGADATANSFRIAVWSFNNGSPGLPIYISDSVYTPEYGFYHNDFMPFELDKAVYIPGAVFVGVIQTAATGMHMGLDVNTTNATPKFYGSGFTWYQSLVPGTVMMRPYLRYTPLTFGGEEPSIPTANIYPNPATDVVRIETNSQPNISWTLLNSTGQTIATGQTAEINVAHLPRGLYFVQLVSGKTTAHHKLILH